MTEPEFIQVRRNIINQIAVDENLKKKYASISALHFSIALWGSVILFAVFLNSEEFKISDTVAIIVGGYWLYHVIRELTFMYYGVFTLLTSQLAGIILSTLILILWYNGKTF